MGEASESTGFPRKFVSEDGEFALMIEDDGKVGYAYLLDADGQIRGDVWLYKRFFGRMGTSRRALYCKCFSSIETHCEARGRQQTRLGRVGE